MMYNVTMARPKRIETEAEYKARQAMYVQRWRTNNPEKQKLARQRAYNNRKIKAMEVVGGAICRNCGCDELHALEFNHINGGGAMEHRLNGNRPIMDRLLTDKRNFEDLEVLCRVCNALDFIERKIPEVKGKFSVVWNG
jgi:hypothetical protein